MRRFQKCQNFKRTTFGSRDNPVFIEFKPILQNSIISRKEGRTAKSQALSESTHKIK